MASLKLHLDEKGADDSASRIASAVWRQRVREGELHRDVSRWHAPSECHGLVSRSCRREMTQLLLDAGLAPDQYNELMAERVSGKWLYQYQMEIGPSDVYWSKWYECAPYWGNAPAA